MELIEIVKSSTIFFSLVFVLLMLIAFGLYKIRNQAKKDDAFSTKCERLSRKDSSSKSAGDLSISGDLNIGLKRVPKIQHQKFEVVNEKVDIESSEEIHINYHSNVYRYYEESCSQKMFKIKVKSEDHT